MNGNDEVFIARERQVTGPYSLYVCDAMVREGRLSHSDLACGRGMNEWRTIAHFLGVSVPSVVSVIPDSPLADPEGDDSIAAVIGQMGVGCLMWGGLVVLAIGGGIIFPLLLLLLPVAIVGWIVDLAKKTTRLMKRRQMPRHKSERS